MRSRPARLGVVALLPLGLVATVAWRYAGPSASHEDNALAIALASRDGSTVADQEAATTRLPRGHAHVRTAATASASCAGCVARASSLQIVYGRSARHLTADNVATAWSSCTDCTSGALSLQIVLVDRLGDVVAGNRAVAANVDCTDCRTTAVAYQVVVVGSSGKVLPAAARRQIDALRAQLESSLDNAAPAGASRVNAPAAKAANAAAPDATVDATIDQVARIVSAATGAKSAVVHRDVRRGP